MPRPPVDTHLDELDRHVVEQLERVRRVRGLHRLPPHPLQVLSDGLRCGSGSRCTTFVGRTDREGRDARGCETDRTRNAHGNLEHITIGTFIFYAAQRSRERAASSSWQVLIGWAAAAIFHLSTENGAKKVLRKEWVSEVFSVQDRSETSMILRIAVLSLVANGNKRNSVATSRTSTLFLCTQKRKSSKCTLRRKLKHIKVPNVERAENTEKLR